jgi:hypothetical protein
MLRKVKSTKSNYSLDANNKTLLGLIANLARCNIGVHNRPIILCIVDDQANTDYNPENIGILGAAYMNQRIAPLIGDRSCYIIVYRKHSYDVNGATSQIVARLIIKDRINNASFHYPENDISCTSLLGYGCVDDDNEIAAEYIIHADNIAWRKYFIINPAEINEIVLCTDYDRAEQYNANRQFRPSLLQHGVTILSCTNNYTGGMQHMQFKPLLTGFPQQTSYYPTQSNYDNTALFQALHSLHHNNTTSAPSTFVTNTLQQQLEQHQQISPTTHP